MQKIRLIKKNHARAKDKIIRGLRVRIAEHIGTFRDLLQEREFSEGIDGCYERKRILRIFLKTPERAKILLRVPHASSLLFCDGEDVADLSKNVGVKRTVAFYGNDSHNGCSLDSLLADWLLCNTGYNLALITEFIRADPSFIALVAHCITIFTYDTPSDSYKPLHYSKTRGIARFCQILESLGLSFVISTSELMDLFRLGWAKPDEYTRDLLNAIQSRQATYTLMRAWTARAFPLPMFDAFIMREICRYISESMLVLDEE